MIKHATVLVAALALVGAAGCTPHRRGGYAGPGMDTDAGSDSDSGTDAGSDSGTVTEVDMGHPLGGPFVPASGDPTATCTTPRGPYGFSEGYMQQDWTVSSCSGGAYSLYNNDYCIATLTVVIHSEPWCGECLADAPSMRANLIDPYAARNVRILEVLQDDESGGSVDAATCNAWASAYDNAGYVFMDPEQNLSTYSYRPGIDETPPGSRTEGLPVVNIYDETGTLVFHHEGSTNEWRDITTALDGLLR